MTMYRIRVNLGGFQGAPGLAVHYFDFAGGSAQDAADAVAVLWGGFESFLYDTVTWSVDTAAAIIDETNGDLDGVTTITPASGGGTNTTEPLPPSQMGLVRWVTSGVVNNRVLRGRTFVGPTTQDANDSGLLTSASQTDLQNAANAFLAVTDADPVIWHRPPEGQSSGVFHPITGASVWNNFAVLRGRRD